ncbi:MAG: hypothetical protein ABW217_05105 [Polyangiaceae bacterium]
MRSLSPGPRALAPLLAALSLIACGSADDPAVIGASDGDVQSNDEAPAPPGAPGSSQLPVPDDVIIAGTCAGEVAAETFASALCSCQDTNIAGYLKTRSFQPGDAGEPERLGGSVGVNESYSTSGYADVGGGFTVSGPRELLFGGLLRAGQDLKLAPSASVAGVIEVGRDAWLTDDVRAFGRVAIERDLYTSAGVGFRGIAVVDVGGEERTQAVSVAPPCACGAGEIIDVSALVAEGEADNDNAGVGLDVDALNAEIGAVEVTLPGGRYFVHQIGGVGAMRLNITGKTAIFVEDDVIATGAFAIELAPDAELDLFVRDNLVITGAARFGDRARPSATRVYVGGTGDIAIAGYAAFVGNLYAPTANVVIGGYGQIYGSLFGKNITAAGFVSVGYDESIQQPGSECPPSDGQLPRVR